MQNKYGANLAEISFDNSGDFILSHLTPNAYNYQFVVLSDISAQGSDNAYHLRDNTNDEADDWLLAYKNPDETSMHPLNFLRVLRSNGKYSLQKNFIVTSPTEVEDTFTQTSELTNYSPLVETKIRSPQNLSEINYLYPVYDPLFNCQRLELGSDSVINIPDCQEVRFGDFVISSDENMLVFAARESLNAPIRLYAHALDKQSNVVTLTNVQESVLTVVDGNAGTFYSIEKTDFDLAITKSGQVIYKDSDNYYRIDLDGQNKQLLKGVTDYHILEDNTTAVFQLADNMVRLYDFAVDEELSVISADSKMDADNFTLHVSGNMYYETGTQLYALRDEQVAPLELISSQWNLVSLADADEAGISVTQALQDSGLDAGRYGRNLYMYAIEHATGKYIGLETNSMLRPGKAYWLNQWTGSTMRYEAAGGGTQLEAAI